MAKQTKLASAEPTIVRANNYISIYSNNAQLQMSAFDMRMIFGESSSAENGQQIEQKISIVMSLHHAKVFAQMLSENIKLYEETVGELKLPARAPDSSLPLT